MKKTIFVEEIKDSRRSDFEFVIADNQDDLLKKKNKIGNVVLSDASSEDLGTPGQVHLDHYIDALKVGRVQDAIECIECFRTNER